MIVKNKLVLVVILTIAAILRLWNLDTNPPHLYSDEAAIGYNAYSILKTGRDEHGEFLPIVFKSFGDWKPGLYIYSTVPFIATLGLSELSVRLPSAIAGIVAVFLLYILAKELFKNEKIAFLISLCLALTPWHIHFSRGAWEANLSLTILLGGTLCFVKSISGKKKYLLPGAILFALTLWTYQGAKLASLIVLGILTYTYRKPLLEINRKLATTTILMGIILTLPILLSLIDGKAGRLSVYSLFSYERPPESIDRILSQEGVSRNSWQYKLYHTETLSFVRGLTGRWVNHYSGRFLFFEGDWSNPRHQAPETGMLLLIQLPLLLLGTFILVRQKDTKAISFILLWLILAPLPAALSRDSVHAVRSFNLVIPLAVLTGLGVWGITEFLQKQKKKVAFPISAALCCIFILNYWYYLDNYFVHYPKRNAQAWLYGYKEVIGAINKKNYDEVIFQQSYNQPYMFFLFYKKYDPEKYQATSRKYYEENPYGDVGKISRLDNISFRNATESDLHKPGTLIIFDPETPPYPAILEEHRGGEVGEVKRPNGSTAFRILKFSE